jgi:FAD/FMN-containing dehydrogenase
MVDDHLILRGADGYNEARFARVFNARRPERYPAAVLVAESDDDVVEGVRLARDRGWKVAIRAGGHSFPAWSLRDDGLVIDLGGFKETTFDESTGVVSVTPSVSGGELNAYLSGYDRFFTTGDCPSLGLGGFRLQGGVGMGFRGWGYAAEQIASIDVVTADGELVTADEQSNSDLFWAARGAGPGFCERLRDSTSGPAPFQRDWPQRRTSTPWRGMPRSLNGCGRSTPASRRTSPWSPSR